MGFDIGSILGGGLGKVITDVIGQFKLSPEKKLEFEKAIAENEQVLKVKEYELQTKLLETQTKEIEVASANIRAEVESGDKFTSRARPSFLYMCIFILGWNYIAVPLFHHTPLELPEALFWLFGSCVLGYTGARTWEKIGIPTGKK